MSSHPSILPLCSILWGILLHTYSAKSITPSNVLPKADHGVTRSLLSIPIATWFQIQNQQSGQCLKHSTGDIIPSVGTCSLSDLYQWNVYGISGNYFQLKNTNTGQCLTQRCISSSPGSPCLDMGVCTSDDYQYWSTYDESGYYFNLRNKGTLHCLYQNSDGRFGSYGCNIWADQRWKAIEGSVCEAPPEITNCPDADITVVKGDSWTVERPSCSSGGLKERIDLDQCSIEFYTWECTNDCGTSNPCYQTVNICAHTDAPTASPTDAPTAYYDYFDVGDIIYLKAVACNQYLRDRESYSRISLTSTRDQNRQRWKISDVQDIGGIRKVKLVNYHDIANNRGLWIENGDLKTNKNKGDWFSFEGYKSGDKFYVNMENGGKCPYWGGCGDGRVSMDSKGCNDNYKIEVEFHSGGNDMVEYFEFNNKAIGYLFVMLINVIWMGINYKTNRKQKQDYEQIAQKNDA